MKSYFYLFSLALLLFSCSTEATIEDQLYAEIVKEYEKEGVDLEALLDDIEDQMIKEGLLANDGGLAKVKYYEKIVSSGQVSSLKDFKVLAPLVEHPYNAELISKCQKRVQTKNSVAFAKSRFLKKQQNIQIKVAKEGNVSVVSVSKAILDLVSAEEFEHPYYRMFMLLSFSMMMEKDTAYVRQTPKLLEVKPSTAAAPEKTIEIRLGTTDVVEINGSKYHVDKLEKAYNWAHDKIGSDAIVHLYAHKMSSYGNFAKIHAIIEDYAMAAREKEARKSFNKAYSVLTKAQRKQVNDAHPIAVVETKFE